MAQWYFTEIIFTDRIPTEDQLVRLNHACKQVDYDFPPITATGVDRNWRSPMISLEQALGLLVRAGFPCKGWQIWESHNYYGPPANRTYIVGTLDMVADLPEHDKRNWDEAYAEGVSDELIKTEKLAERNRLLRNYFFEQSIRLKEALDTVDPEDKKTVSGLLAVIEGLRVKYAAKM